MIFNEYLSWNNLKGGSICKTIINTGIVFFSHKFDFNKTSLSCNFGITVIYGDRGLGGVKAACGESLNVTPFHPVCLRKTLSLRLLRCTRAAQNASHWAFNKKKPVHLWRILISGAESYRKRLEFISTTQWGQITSLCLNCVCVIARAVSLPTNYITASLNRKDSPFSAYWGVSEDMRWVYYLMWIFWPLCGELYAG